MRCEEAVRELSAPTGGLDPVELSDHVTVCSNCAEWSERSRQFDQLWDATRPAEPSAAAWQTVWANVTRMAEPATVPFSAPHRPWRRRVMVGMALAQAAVFLIAGWIAFSMQPERSHYDVAQVGEPLFICLDSRGGRVDCGFRFPSTSELEFADEVDPTPLAWDMELINRMEGAE
jgi:hypothetical protein